MNKFVFAVRHRRAYAYRMAEFTRHPVQPGDIVFLGDSITHSATFDEWFPDRPVRNWGIAGDFSGAVLKRVGQIRHDPAAVFILIGTNDVGDGRPAAATIDTVGQIVAAIRTQCPQTAIYVQSVMPRSPALAPLIDQVNAGFAQLAAASGATYLNIHPLFLGQDDAIRPAYSPDELHLTPAGYEVWREALRPLVMAL